MKRSKSLLKWLLRCVLLVPLIMGTVGFLQEGAPFNDALFMAVTLYALEYGDGGNGLLVEIARWTAPLATASGLLLLLSQLRQRLHNYLLNKKGTAVAVYGNNRDAVRLLNQLGSCGIEGNKDFVQAQRYILAGEESFNLAFYHQHRDRLKDRSVYLKCSSLPAQASAPANLHLYSSEETAARLFWKRSNMISLSMTHDHCMDVVILGFGELGEHLLTTALQQNIFSPHQHITYHVFGDDNGFAATHPQLHQISDPVVFHSEPWYEEISLLNKAAMVIVAQQSEQTALVDRLLLTLICPQLQVFVADSFGLEILDDQSRLELFHWKQEADSPEQIFNTKLFDNAKKLNLAYAVRYNGSTRTAEEEWAALNGFTRYSNISSADYFDVLRTLLNNCGQPADFAALSEEWKDRLAELEHIRWCRYHYLNNWTHGIPENGAAKDTAKRIHRSLVPYHQLSPEEQKKDLDNIALMFELSE